MQGIEILVAGVFACVIIILLLDNGWVLSIPSDSGGNINSYCTNKKYNLLYV